jgi:hypothetical protein
MRDFGFGTRSVKLENLMQQEIQDVVDVLNGRKEDKVCFAAYSSSQCLIGTLN